MQLEELEITMEFEEIEVLQKATRNEENLFAKMMCVTYVELHTKQ